MPEPTGGQPRRRGLVVGIGNVLRTDDGVGLRAVERLEADPRLIDAVASGGLRVFWVQQLTPELAVDFSAADVVVLIDADAGLAPGAVSRRLTSSEPAASAGASLTHHVDVGSLAAMAADLYGGSPEVIVVGVGPESLAVGEALTARVERALPVVVDTVVQLLGEELGA